MRKKSSFVSGDHHAEQLHDLLDKELAVSAPLAWKTAPDTCFIDHRNYQPCLAYHRTWQLFLQLGLAKSLRTDTDFLLNSYRNCLAQNKSCRFLISGAADYGLLAHILWAAELEGGHPHITVLDKCKTSLWLNQWYAKRRGVDIEMVHSDILRFTGDAPYQCISTHSFFGWFPPAGQQQLVKLWSDHLDAKGCIITSVRLRPSLSPTACKLFDEKEIRSIQQSVLNACHKHSAAESIDKEELMSAVYDRCINWNRYPITSEQMLTDLFSRSGLQIIRMDQDSHTLKIPDNRPIGPIKGAGNRVNIIAVRP